MLRSVLSARGRLIVLGVVLVVGAGLALWASQYYPGWYWEMAPNGTVAASLATTVVFAVATVAFVPRPMLATGVGALFSLPVALAITIVGTVLGAGIAFGLGRVLGRDAVRSRLSRGTLGAWETRFAEHGFLATVVCRFVPVVPFAAVNYGAALTRVGGPWCFRTGDQLKS